MIINNCRIDFSERITAQHIEFKYESNSTEYKMEELAYIEKQWQTTLARNTAKPDAVFNGDLFSLLSWNIRNGKLELALGDTNYKEYVGTRNHEFKRKFPCTRIANPLAVCAVIVTNDGEILIERRNGVDVYGGSFHVIGGFMDRNMDIVNGVLGGPFYAIKREVREETFLDISNSLGGLTGLVYDEKTPHPELCFSFNVDQSLKEIIDNITNYADGEVGDVFGIDNNSSSLERFLIDNYEDTSITGFGSLLLHGRVAFGHEWFLRICSEFISNKV